MMRMPSLLLCCLSLLAVGASLAGATMLEVPSASYPTIQSGLDAAQPGDWVVVASGTYSEALSFPRSGVPGQAIVLMGAPGAVPRLDASTLSEDNVITITDRSHIRIFRFEIFNHTVVDDGSAVRITGSGTDIVLGGLQIHDVTGVSAMAITVYGTEASPISDLVIRDCIISNIDAAPSEAMTLNGNVDGFLIADNLVHDINNIGIDMIGGETDIQPDTTLVARNGVVRGNIVRRANSSYEGGYAGGIYVDGGRDILIEANIVESCDLGIEIGAENFGLLTSGVIVRNNQISASERAGLVFGGFAESAGRVEDCVFRGNTLVANNTLGENGQGTYFSGGGIAEIWVQWGSNNLVEHNIVEGAPPIAAPFDIVLVANWEVGSASTTTIDNNLYWSIGGGTAGEGAFAWNDVYYGNFNSWTAGTSFDGESLHSDPELNFDPDTGRYHIAETSVARDRARSDFTPSMTEIDIDFGRRQFGSAVDLGADEYGSYRIFADSFELADLSGWSAEVMLVNKNRSSANTSDKDRVILVMRRGEI